MVLLEVPHTDSSSFERAGLELYAVAKRHNIAIPPPNSHIYISGLVERLIKPSSSTAQYVASSVKDLEKKVKERDKHHDLNALYQVMFQSSGDFYFNLAAMTPDTAVIKLAQEFYAYASMYSARMGKVMLAHVFEDLHNNTHARNALLKSYYIQGAQLQNDDVQAFHRHVQAIKDKEDFDDLIGKIGARMTPAKSRLH